MDIYHKAVIATRDYIHQPPNGASRVGNPLDYQSRPRGYETFFMINSTEYEIFHAHNVKIPTNIGILTFMSGKNSILSLSELKNPYFLIFLYLCAFKISCPIELSMKELL